MAVYVKNGQLTYVDENGNEYILHPETTVDQVIGAAPAGLVSAHYEIPRTGTEEQLENILATEYASMEDRTERHISIGVNPDGLSLPKSTHLVYISRTDVAYGTFRTIGYDSDGGVNLLARNLIAGVLHPWEWENPHMRPGVEYRTTERYKGYPVYKKVDGTGNILWRAENETEWHLLASAEYIATATVE